MHKVTIVLLLTLIPFFGMSQNTISGKIVDELGLPIYMASVEIDQTDDITYTDYEGAFILTSNKDFHWKINIKSKGYKAESFFVLDGGKTSALILEYDEEMKKLLGGNSSINLKYHLKPFFKKFMEKKSQNQLAKN
ncbi:carboxypeptidase-like regulatory domain-containing protein [uncultured Croceitalea sp.]|uniref:carboxypeptidase-like regulatory domain-containing protein n=1 Tax=uncultured Croceitalea sp. TaxID=1798908 RepID=UPI00374F44D4